VEAKARFLIVFGVALFGLLLKWVTIRFVAVGEIRDRCLKRFGSYPEIPRFGYLLRRLGWDLANAALGMMAIAYVLESSNFRSICAEKVANYEFLFAVFLSFIYVGLYAFASVERYIYLEAAEKLCVARNLRGKQWWYATTLFLVGLLMLLQSSWFVVGAK
jgi:hypothetical protein